MATLDGRSRKQKKLIVHIVNNVDYIKLFDSYFRSLPVDVLAESGGDSTPDDPDTVVPSQEGPP